MTAMNTARIPRKLGSDPAAAAFGEVPVAAAVNIYRGALVFLLASGYASSAPAATALCLGIAAETVDNSAGSAGDLSVVPLRGTYAMVNSAGGDELTLADIGKRVFAVDDQTVAKTSGSGTRCVAGMLVAIEEGRCYIEIGLDPAEGITIDAATDALLVHKAGAETITGPKTFTDATSPIITAKLGPSAGQQHTLPVVTSDTIVLLDAAQTLTSKTLTSPRVGTAILDANGNEVIVTPATASAVNEVTVTNSATGNAPSIAATGTDADIGLTLAPKGTGTVSLAVGATGSLQLGGNAGALIGEYGVAPTARSAAIIDAAGGGTIDSEARTAINALLAYLRLRGTVTP